MTVKEECKMKRTCEKFQKWIAMILVLILFLQPLAECRVYAAENENFESVSENEGYRVYKTVFDESCLTKEIPGTGDQDVSGGNGDVSGNNEDVSGGNGDVSANNEDVSGGNSDVSGKDVMDTDQDGITDEMELTIGWDPLNPDTDCDGIPDGYAMHVLYPLLLHYGFDEEREILAFRLSGRRWKYYNVIEFFKILICCI